jgi:hypothetical protein
MKASAHVTDAHLSRRIPITTVTLAKGCAKHAHNAGFLPQSPGRAGHGHEKEIEESSMCGAPPGP